MEVYTHLGADHILAEDIQVAGAAADNQGRRYQAVGPGKELVREMRLEVMLTAEPRMCEADKVRF